MLIAVPLRHLSIALVLVTVGFTVRAQPAQPPENAQAEPPGNATAQQQSAPAQPPGDAPVETVLYSRNTSMLELTGNTVSLAVRIHSRETGRDLIGTVEFELEGDESLDPTDALTCVPSLTLGCGVVARFSAPRSRSGPPTVLEVQVQDGVFRLSDGPGFLAFIEGVVASDTMAIKLRVDQQRDFVVDLRAVRWPLAPFGPEHPFSRRFAGDPVLEGLKRRYPARYLRIVNLVRNEVPDKGTLSPEAERKILEAMHGAVASLRPMVPDELLERIVFNASAAAKAVGAQDPGLCNALAVAAKSAVTAPALQDTELARQEYALWQEVVEQSDPRFMRKVPNELLLPSTDRFEANVRIANDKGCGMFAAVIDAMLQLPPKERRLWLRATVGTTESPGPEPSSTRGR